ncbi:2-oxo acid dehydrogenase subunit E2 [Euzebya pacifica]|mgnify:CR=1 FL=1|jgi:pyruvate dehydrogenase E2 component (dihydrolipoamide acetyltransferase)|uniref:2-oxo acid dehydrogenase subunit E2 n=1 Tax=Euzebya pacifica TaxID=1608957 RepID=UPI0030FB5A14
MATRLTGWRKISAATWGPPTDPQIYGDLELDARPLLAHQAACRAAGHEVTMTHLVGKAVAHALAEHPDLNVRIHRGRAVRRDDVEIFFIASAGGGDDLSGIKVAGAHQKAVTAIATEVAERAGRIRGGDDELGEAKALLDRMPTRLLRLVMALVAKLAVDWNLDLPSLGVRRQTFGSALVSSVGMFGITHAYAPLSRFYRVPFLVLIGEVEDRAVVDDGQVVARPMLTVTATLDHRYLDGFHAARLARSLKAYCADPTAHEPGVTP